ncbi:hypothetical protein KI688_004871 [Linnemannia hyalina]|uniref:Crinkler effector protein N-terminal domain-containing protein n=1 Tax=Linnemannia hyalina TaxID=64524 RepID=A0A9P8BRU1_9FUNG|nr:hypothetical protein KI688_004871 [Linnemannia hyalina]
MADNHLTLFCLVDGEDTSNAFSIKIPSSDTIDDLPNLIMAKKTMAYPSTCPWLQPLLSLANSRINLAPAPLSLIEHATGKNGGHAITRLSGIWRIRMWKTRSVLGMLCLQWGLYLNAAKNELGLNDLSRLPDSIGTEAMEEQGPGHNTAFACNKTLLLFLSRLLVLKYCLRISDCRQTFSSASWALLQVCLHMFQDVFSELLSILYNKLEGLTIFESALRPIVRHELLSVRKSLAAHAYPNFSSESKLRLVVDKAQDLSDKGSTKFQSFQDGPVPIWYKHSPADSDLSSRLFEGILEIVKWNAAIDKTETMITSWKDRERRGNLCGEFNR